MSKEKLCKNCGKPVEDKAVICPSCGVKIKKPIFKKWWFWVVAAIFVIAIASGNDSSENQNNNSGGLEVQESQQTQNIEYEVYTVSQLIDDLEANALKAEEKYKNKYVEITGELSNIDSDGKYISLSPENNQFSFVNVQCYIKNDEQKSQVMELSKGDVLTIKGKIKSIGEIMGYSLDIDSIN